jgi:hypothetical protein
MKLMWFQTFSGKLACFDVDLERDLGFVVGNGKRFLKIGKYYIQVKYPKVKTELTDYKTMIIRSCQGYG